MVDVKILIFEVVASFKKGGKKRREIRGSNPLKWKDPADLYTRARLLDAGKHCVLFPGNPWIEQVRKFELKKSLKGNSIHLTFSLGVWLH